MNKQLTDAQAKTVDALVVASKRKKNVPIRNSFVQISRGKKPVPGPLSTLVTSTNWRSLDLYLLHRLAASAAPWDTKRDSAVWARALGLGDEKYGKDAVSKCWRKLSDLKLVLRERESKQAKITTLLEDGSDTEYTAPAGNYFTLPLGYWTDGWYHRLSDSGKAALLIASSLQPGFYLPGRLVKRWVGISDDTFFEGATDLHNHGLLTYDDVMKEDYNRGEIAYKQRHYYLQKPFGQEAKGQIDAGIFLSLATNGGR